MIPLRPSACLLRLVSWLLVALIPGLLMLATFGLERLEASLGRESLSTADVDEFLEQAEDSDVDTLARVGMDGALDGIHQRLSGQDTPPAALVEAISAPGLPTREYLAQLANTEFRQTRHANRV
ncbi:membrane protein [Mycolicibacterium aurum]|uniref:Membrane protein n=1 Tax=Mycolicibacterium aurum TaxID=1791 RepID=A0A3S4S7I5_MYCAU|nr:membrane protein [Mycolicibacterium aurum]